MDDDVAMVLGLEHVPTDAFGQPVRLRGIFQAKEKPYQLIVLGKLLPPGDGVLATIGARTPGAAERPGEEPTPNDWRFLRRPLEPKEHERLLRVLQLGRYANLAAA